jgi:tetratricopeptide (TPR) repeat protein
MEQFGWGKSSGGGLKPVAIHGKPERGSMQKTHVNLTVFCLIVSLVILSSAEAAQYCDNWMVKVVSVQGAVQAKRSETTSWTTVEPEDTYCPGDSIRVGERGRAALLLQNETVLRMDQNTTITLVGVEQGRTSILELLRGMVLFFTRTPSGVKVVTPFVNGNVEGTEFLVQVDESRTVVTVFEGRVSAVNDAGSLIIDKNGSAVAEAGKAPVSHPVVRPRDAVQWALYYPQVPGEAFTEEPGAEEDWRQKAGQSQRFFSQGDLAAAFESISGIDTQQILDTRFFTYRAFLDLAVGRFDSAASDLERALELDPAASYAYALKSVMAVARNKKDDALKFAEKAVELDPGSSSALIALSYAQQASFNLEGARASLEKAVAVNPRDALAWARLAEVWLSFGFLDRSLDAAGRAVEIDPRQSRTQTVLGYAYLTQIDTRRAKNAFRKAILLDQADPLPRLGLGLALIRDGDLKAGRTEIEIAAILDPDNSLIRSYLGKAYYEEKREKLAGLQFQQAKELDPHDPTPWFYDAILKDTTNRPVDALHDLEKSVELNDDRAVYRSRLLLDQDLAARSAGLGQIYNDLGFQQEALVQGWKSLNTDPANFSAHRLLSDSYAFVPRHDMARVSELLQSQLLQPININPVPPQLGESNLLIPSGLGPRDVGFNEFNALFNRNRAAVLASGIAGTQGTLGDEVTLSGVYDKVSFSAGQLHYQSDGIRQNDDLARNIYDVFTQVSLSPKTSVQAEYRDNRFKSGELDLFFEPGDILGTRSIIDTQSFRAGLHHNFEPGSDFIASFIHRDQDANQNLPKAEFGALADSTGYSIEGQYLFHSAYFNLIGGVGYLTTDVKESQVEVGKQSPVNKLVNPHTNCYLYSQINYPANVTWTLGGSGDFADIDTFNLERRQFNPKFGVMWSPLPGTTVRAAAIRTLTRSGEQEQIFSGETLEPTSVAGFNQFFDDGPGVDAWRYGIGIDQKITSSVYAGAEVSKRELSVPGTSNTNEVIVSDFDERLAMAYFYWTPDPYFALGPEYRLEQFRHPLEFLADRFSTLDTHRISLGAAFFHPSGFIDRLKPTIVFQEGDFQQFESTPLGPPRQTIVNRGNSFFVLDASVGYLLPKRWGLLTVEARNLFDRSFKFQDTDPANPEIFPTRSVLVRLTLSF